MYIVNHVLFSLMSRKEFRSPVCPLDAFLNTKAENGINGFEKRDAQRASICNARSEAKILAVRLFLLDRFLFHPSIMPSRPISTACACLQEERNLEFDQHGVGCSEPE